MSCNVLKFKEYLTLWDIVVGKDLHCTIVGEKVFIIRIVTYMCMSPRTIIVIFIVLEFTSHTVLNFVVSHLLTKWCFCSRVRDWDVPCWDSEVHQCEPSGLRVCVCMMLQVECTHVQTQTLDVYVHV